MSKICPNCLHPVRTGANYCGYCGTSLVPTPRDPAPTNRSSKETTNPKSNSSAKIKRFSKSGQSGRSWLKVPITLMVLVILVAMAVRFWPEILVFIGQAVVMLKLT